MADNVTVSDLLDDDFLGYEKSQNHSIKIACVTHRQHRIEEVFCFITHYFLRQIFKTKTSFVYKYDSGDIVDMPRKCINSFEIMKFPPVDSDLSDTLHVTFLLWY